MSNKQDEQQITKAKGRPMLSWVGKKPLEKVEYFPAQEKEVYGDKTSKEFNELFWGDNLQVLSHLLKEFRGKIDLIYIDPPFDSKADYVRKVKIRGERVAGQLQNLLEEKQYTDIWENDEYLQFMYERLLIMKELLSDTGSIYIHCDWHKNSYLRLIMDEVFGYENLVNEITWYYPNKFKFEFSRSFGTDTETLFLYARNKGKHTLNHIQVPVKNKRKQNKVTWDAENKKMVTVKDEAGNVVYYEKDEKIVGALWEIPRINSMANEDSGYPTQKPEELLVRIISASSNKGDLVMDCFSGSGTTMAVAQKLGRRWIGCDINIGAIQTTTKRLAQIIDDQLKTNGKKLIKDDLKGLLAFKVLNVNEYDIFKNEIEAKEIVTEMYGVELIKRSSFDGTLDNHFVKVMPLNRVLNKLDVKTVLKDIDKNIDSFTVRTTQKQGEEVYEEGVMVICSGAELDVEDFLKKENKSGVKVVIRDILNDKKNLIFKQKPEANIKVEAKDKKLTVTIQEFYSPILMRKLELENEKVIDKKDRARVEDFKQIIDSVAIDVDYDGKLFNAEMMDLPEKKEVISTEYQYSYEKGGKYTVAIKVVDVLGEEYFETFNVEA